MKRFLLLVFACVLVLPISVFGAPYEIKDQNVTIELDDNWVVFTRENISGNTKLAEMNISEDYMKNLLESNDAYMDAIYQEKALELFLRIKDADVDSIANYNEKQLNAVKDNFIKEAKASEGSVIKNDYNYIYTKYLSGDYRILSYYTVVNGKGYTFTIQKLSDLTEEDKNIGDQIVSNIKFKVNEESKKSSDSKLKDSVIIIGIIVIVVGFLLFVAGKSKKKKYE